MSNIFKNLEEQMKDARGSDFLTDGERRGLKTGTVPEQAAEHTQIMGRQAVEFVQRENPKMLPLIYKKGSPVRVYSRSRRKVEDDWRVLDWRREGLVTVVRDDPKKPGELPGKTITFKEFYVLNPPDETCENADYLGEFREQESK